MIKNFVNGFVPIMAMKGKGGGGGAGAMLEYGDKALELQKSIYDSQRADAQPWYQAGTSAVNRLSDLMGLSGGSVKSREQIYKDLLPQYTTQSTSSGSLYATPSGRVIDFSKSQPMFGSMGGEVGGTSSNNNNAQYEDWARGSALYNNKAFDELKKAGYSQIGGGSSSVDHAGLNAAVEAALASQGTPSDYGALAKAFSMEDYQQDPGYQFRLAEGNKALERKLNAQGKTYSPESAKALMEYNQNMGSQEYNNAYNRYNIDQDSLFNRLAALSGYGQTATGQIANAGANYSNSASDILTGQGNAITSSNLANQANNSSMFNTLLGTAGQLGSAYIKSDIRLKTDIQHVGQENGHDLYTFKYINDPSGKTYRGVMAQLVQEYLPEAITEVDGFKAVNYALLGLEMTEVTNAA